MRIRNAAVDLPDADVVLVGAGIMSATLASMLGHLEPEWSVVVLEAADRAATESSDPWNNAGTGHSGFCELNYMPDPEDSAKAESIAAQFLLTREWWAHLAAAGGLDPASFIHTTGHLSVVFDGDTDYLRRRHATLRRSPLFDRLEFTYDPATVGAWAPLVTDGRAPGPIAATRHPDGTDVDFGALSTGLLETSGAEVLFGHRVRRIARDAHGRSTVTGRGRAGRFRIRARHVFVGAGGQALRQLQKAKLDEVSRYGVLPVGAAFLRCDAPEVVARHDGKVYGQAPIGAPPMSVPHLDRRTVRGRDHLMFGPYATFSTRLLKGGHLWDFFATLHPRNLWTVMSAAATNLDLVRYLVSELLAGRAKRFAQLQRYLPEARDADWTLVHAGQRAQLVTPGPGVAGVLQQGTELIVSADRQVSGLLGASPGASTAVPIMIDLLRRAFPAEWSQRWAEDLHAAVPDLRVEEWTHDDVRRATAETARALRLRPPAEHR
ncbi:malate:quinone oxidoreductase [Gordonia sihwensis]|uniref:malate:quinone oxidoreductase n=1 Tax=Gordonia sihwensis TaxID=173559 RepID=UPI0005EFDD6E|nr:malate:quinone oxidoreductase [Gordonia sihwensis]KJR09473.1 malate:quinone oxidoreductase [Gordonia sihwensis]